eukprot:CAMPEP_0182457200 /NCGR_PEP_ID=MMETSP1319-20130603/2827_1 /TAXON_ID=172717 /ORGANISM="Bolidomonas pacifica, Strain RCC208" /LENGTH=163 /DNA_ID=CAMNT_0024655615 /DNA_START=91 /DNA_END=582 /DNA_ORIENTATION=+
MVAETDCDLGQPARCRSALCRLATLTLSILSPPLLLRKAFPHPGTSTHVRDRVGGPTGVARLRGVEREAMVRHHVPHREREMVANYVPPRQVLFGAPKVQRKVGMGPAGVQKRGGGLRQVLEGDPERHEVVAVPGRKGKVRVPARHVVARALHEQAVLVQADS